MTLNHIIYSLYEKSLINHFYSGGEGGRLTRSVIRSGPVVAAAAASSKGEGIIVFGGFRKLLRN